MRMRRRQRHGERGRCTNLEQPLSGSVYIHIYMYISVTRLSLTWSLCPWRVNYKVEPTIPSLAKRNRWIQLASRGETNPRLHPFNRSLGPGRCVFTDGGKKKDRFVRRVWLICFRWRRDAAIRFPARNPPVPALITIQEFIWATC